MLNRFLACVIGYMVFIPGPSVGHADSKLEEETNTEKSEAATSTSKAPGEIVFVPHDFGAPEVTEAGGVRGTPRTMIKLLVPEKLSKALSPTPTFYWYVDQPIDELRFTLIEESAIDPLLEISLDPMEEVGIHSLALHAHDISLEEHGLYRWSIAARSEQDLTAVETVAQTLFLYDGDHETIPVEASPAKLSSFLAKNGYWYDLLDLVSHQSDAADVDRANWRALHADLLEQIGFAP